MPVVADSCHFFLSYWPREIMTTQQTNEIFVIFSCLYFLNCCSLVIMKEKSNKLTEQQVGPPTQHSWVTRTTKASVMLVSMKISSWCP